MGCRCTYNQDNDKEEEDVGDIVELEPNILGYKRQWRVFGGSNLVSGVAAGRMPLVIEHAGGQGQVKEDGTVVGVFFSVVFGGFGIVVVVVFAANGEGAVAIVAARGADALFAGRRLFAVVSIEQGAALGATALDCHSARGPSSSLGLDLVEVGAVGGGGLGGQGIGHGA